MLRPQFAPARFGKESSGAEAKADAKNVGSLSLGTLAEAKKAAFRRGIWFRVLNRVERGVVDLTMRYVDDIKSTKLAKVLTAIMEKLQLATESIADRLARTVGVSLAKKISDIAVSWGNGSASQWAEDRSFARYLAFSVART